MLRDASLGKMYGNVGYFRYSIVQFYISKRPSTPLNGFHYKNSKDLWVWRVVNTMGEYFLRQYITKAVLSKWLYAASFFELERGVRQRCPLTGTLFVIAVEILANSIRNDQMIEGIIIKGREFKLSQYADDTSCFKRGENSLQRIFDKISAFKSCGGLELNESKTEAMCLGKYRLQPSNFFGISWPLK